MLLFGFSIADYNMKEDKQLQMTFFRSLTEKLENSIVINNYNIESIKKRLKEIDQQVILLSGLFQNPSGNDSKENILIQEAEMIFKKEKVEKLKEEFKKRILWLYKNGIDYQTQILFTSESPVSFYSRLEYLNKMSSMRKQDFERIKFEEYSIQEKKKLITLDQAQRREYISKKKQEEDILLEEKSMLEDSLKILKFDNESYVRQIERIKSIVERTEAYIGSLTTNFVYKIDEKPEYEEGFENNKGKIIFPVQSVDIIRDFGRCVNPQTGTISYNFGIDVSIAAGSPVKTVFDGEVEEIIEIPYYRNMIIINHTEGYRTVYGLVRDIAVKKGSRVKTGDVIAYTSYTSTEQSFHFEIRKDFVPVDPKTWLKIGYSVFVKL
jgi:murein hydrolase activator